MNKQVKRELQSLSLKIAIVLVTGGIMMGFILGVAVVPDDAMDPAVKPGDVVLFDRNQSNLINRDVVVLYRNQQKTIRRIVAVEGDCVDITEAGLVINGYVQQETQITHKTKAYKEGISFPITLEPGEIFVLGDIRSQVEDSRIYGPIKQADCLGRVITVIRRRGI
ncbi:signal peptidase I [Granulicatella balaenopterae]|uniref:Signal peptidase I n=1 Tax=Granulicatella balaenopterae TaxID=137733 RepID=A0A1H9GWL0_9LACT|nr:signal peptidase I [Granulicatella balaenopterae]SEQ54414.1 signal peptidase I [Granulicatella balaenopterae]